MKKLCRSYICVLYVLIFCSLLHACSEEDHDVQVNTCAQSGNVNEELDKIIPPRSVGFPIDGPTAAQLQIEWAKFERRNVNLTNTIGMNLVFIPKGEFVMGSPESELGRESDEIEHKVAISRSFYIGATSVTQGQWRKVMGTDPPIESRDNHGDQFPAGDITWTDAVEFCQRLSRIEGVNYRLPSEEEWEYACRSGSEKPFGDILSLDDVSWYDSNSDGHRTHRVGLKKPNSWGIYDMHGNVANWCDDWYHDYITGKKWDPTGHNILSRIDRGGTAGGSWNSARAAARDFTAPDARSSHIGLRVVLDFGAKKGTGPFN